MKAKRVKPVYITIKSCKAASLVSIFVAICIVFLSAPMIFGLQMFSVKQTDCTDYPVNALAYYTYTPAEDYFPGDCAAVKTERGFLVLKLTENDPETRGWRTSGDFKTYAEVPYEYFEGRVSTLCLPNMGFIVDERLVLLPVFAGSAVLFYGLAHILSKKLYAPKYGKDESALSKGEAENGTDA